MNKKIIIIKKLNEIFKIFKEKFYFLDKIISNFFFIIIVIGIVLNIYLFYFAFFYFLIKIYLRTNRNIPLILAYIILGIFITDLSSYLKFEKNHYKIESNIEYDIDKNYGYYPPKNSKFKETVFFKDKILKENNYSINEFGHRKLFNKPNNLSKCIVFHGGSITFGQSLNDNEVLPFYLKNNLGDKYNIYNFAFNGYGPHQFLSKLKNNYLEEIKNCQDIIVIYQFIFDHIGRTAGKRSWGDKSPRYVLQKKELIQKGFFSNYPYKIIMKIRKNFRNSKTLSLFFNLDKVSKKDKKVLLEILKQIELEVKKKFNKSEFIYIIWNNHNFNLPKINNFFKNSNHIIIDDLDLSENIKKNMIPGDNHPTKEYNFIVAKELEKKVKILTNFF